MGLPAENRDYATGRRRNRQAGPPASGDHLEFKPLLYRKVATEFQPNRFSSQSGRPLASQAVSGDCVRGRLAVSIQPQIDDLHARIQHGVDFLAGGVEPRDAQS